MGNQVDKKFTWVIKNFSTLQSEKIYSDEFVISGCKWRLLAYPEGNNSPNNFSLYLEVADYESLPSECRRNVSFTFTLVNQFHENLSLVKVTRNWLDQKAPNWGFTSMICLHDIDGGYLLNDELKIVVELDVLEVIGKLDVPEESKEATKPLKTMKHNNDDEDIPGDLVDVNGFQVLPSQVGLARCIFEEHKGPEEQSKDDLSDAEAALVYMMKKKLDEVKESKYKSVRVCEKRQHLHDFEQKSKDFKAQMDKYNASKAEILEAPGPASDRFLFLRTWSLVLVFFGVLVSLCSVLTNISQLRGSTFCEN
ncbi:PREDICTED: MATH domain and coiled-coil domain-containing protein At3g58270-like [Camelina sativa]|uniref:MATH domain and coiled-coil domain-containing protein At3g58270-like n=1 Tax=Camelina sativa TaxID=90675 RepID=A0ABM0TU33_CAMSA|nr:PREDICTED: MATH domain and coiled-coil domain-containing protein At3g58270-like [Camelina sativa]